MLCFRHKKSHENFNKKGKEYALYFEGNQLYRLYKNGESTLLEENAAQTKKLFEEDAAYPNGQLYLINSKNIDWNILDFT